VKSGKANYEAHVKKDRSELKEKDMLHWAFDDDILDKKHSLYNQHLISDAGLYTNTRDPKFQDYLMTKRIWVLIFRIFMIFLAYYAASYTVAVVDKASSEKMQKKFFKMVIFFTKKHR
jgi:hypothetical protein